MLQANFIFAQDSTFYKKKNNSVKGEKGIKPYKPLTPYVPPTFVRPPSPPPPPPTEPALESNRVRQKIKAAKKFAALVTSNPPKTPGSIGSMCSR